MTRNELGDFDWLKQWARLAPNSIALTNGDTGESFSYAELFHLSRAVASEISSRFQISKGDRIAVLAANELETVILFFASLRLGSILVPINFRLTGHEVSHILDDCEPAMVLAQKDLRLALGQSLTAHSKHPWHYEDLQTFTASTLSTYRLEKAKQAQQASSIQAPEFSISANDPCMILYTSGTTGAPKGAIITPKMLHWNSLNTTLRLNLCQSDVFVSFLPLFHTGGWNVLLTPFIHRGARVVLTKKFEAEKVLSLCESEGATIMFGVPTTMDLISRSRNFSTANLSRMRYAIVGGEPMSIDLIRTWQDKGVPIRQGFGLTEFGPNVFSLNEEDAIRKIGSIGFPNFYVDVRVVNKAGHYVTVGEIGELLLRGPVCTPGYWRNEGATREAILDEWFCTGDLVRFDDEGYFYVAGRKKDMFISGGENVYPVEVEHVLSQHPAVREAAVIGVPDPKWGESGHAFISLVSERTVTTAELLDFCRGKLAKFKLPKDVTILPELPKGDSGKILKRRLQKPMQ